MLTFLHSYSDHSRQPLEVPRPESHSVSIQNPFYVEGRERRMDR